MSDTEFLVHEVRSDGGVTFVSGIVNKGSILEKLSFTSIRSEVTDSIPVVLTVTKIVAYRRELRELPRGMSGELHLVGEGAELLKKHDMLLA